MDWPPSSASASTLGLGAGLGVGLGGGKSPLELRLASWLASELAGGDRSLAAAPEQLWTSRSLSGQEHSMKMNQRSGGL